MQAEGAQYLSDMLKCNTVIYFLLLFVCFVNHLTYRHLQRLPFGAMILEIKEYSTLQMH